MSTGLLVFAITSVFLTSALGSLCNSFLFYKFITKKSNSNGFQKICLVKSAANFLICASFLFWVVPVTLFSYTFTQLNYNANRFVGTLSPTWAYYLNAHLQVCLACNRFYGLYFPFGIKIWRSIPIANISIAISIVCSSLYSLVTLPVGCGYVYDPDYFVWRGEYHECSKKIGSIFPYMIFGATFLTNAFNAATGIRLLVSRISGLSKENAEKRKRRWMIMFAQSVVQDCLQLIDTINSYYIVDLNNAIWFQFVFVTLSFITITALDGLVMFLCNSEFHFSCCKARSQRVTDNVTTSVVERI